MVIGQAFIGRWGIILGIWGNLVIILIPSNSINFLILLDYWQSFQIILLLGAKITKFYSLLGDWLLLLLLILISAY